MLQLNLSPLLQAMAVEHPFTFLRKNGFTHNTAHRLLQDPSVLHLNYIEKLCAILNCTPNDLFAYTPPEHSTLPKEHPLNKLVKKEVRGGNLTQALRHLAPEALEKVWGMIDELKNGGDAGEPA